MEIIKVFLYYIFYFILGLIALAVCLHITMVDFIMLMPLSALVKFEPDFETVLYFILCIIMLPGCWFFVFKSMSERKKIILGVIFLLWIAMTMGSSIAKRAIGIDNCSDTGDCRYIHNVKK